MWQILEQWWRHSCHGRAPPEPGAAIGRTAHISFLDNDAFVNMFVQTYLTYFV